MSVVTAHAMGVIIITKIAYIHARVMVHKMELIRRKLRRTVLANPNPKPWSLQQMEMSAAFFLGKTNHLVINLKQSKRGNFSLCLLF